MERLTKRIFVPTKERDLVVFTHGEYIDTILAEMVHEDMRKVLRILAKYEDLEEQGLMLRLPCKIGDTIYEVSYENREFVIKEHIVKEFIYRAYRFPRIEIYCENENGFLACNNIGKLDECLFLTQAEAEQKLKEMDGD